MRKKKSFDTQKATALALAFAVSMTSVTAKVPTLTQAAGKSFTLTDNVTIGDGETYQLSTKGNTKGISFQSSNKKIVTVSKSGKIKGQKSGKATIIAKVNKKRKKCTVTVKKAPKAVKIKNGNLKLYTQNMEQLSVSFTNGYSNKVTFQSANKAVATVSSEGLVTAVGEGKTTITATTFNGKKAKISCVVMDVPKETASSTPVNTDVPFPATASTAPFEPTASVPVFPTETTSVTETPGSTPIAITPNVPTNTPTEAPAETVTSTPGSTFDTPATSSPVPTEQTTAIPDNTPIAPTNTPTEAPAEIVTGTPSATFDTPATSSPVPNEQATAIPDNKPAATHVTDPYIPQTATAIVSKIENGTIYVDNDNKKLQLSDRVRFCKNNYEITMDEIFVGDTITITYKGFVLDRHPSIFVGCEKIEVTNSHSRFFPAQTIGDKDEIHLSLYNHPSPLTYEPSKTKVFKNGKEIPFSELNKGDTVRVNYTYHGSDDGKAGFYETLDTIVVLDDEYTDAITVTGVITK